jgi:putative exporter of polyketide antibiotics
MKPYTLGILFQIPLWLLLALVAIGPILPDEEGAIYPVIFIIVLGAIILHIIGLIKMRNKRQPNPIMNPTTHKEY